MSSALQRRINYHREAAKDANKEAYRWFVLYLQSEDPAEEYYYGKFRIEAKALRRHWREVKKLEARS